MNGLEWKTLLFNLFLALLTEDFVSCRFCPFRTSTLKLWKAPSKLRESSWYPSGVTWHVLPAALALPGRESRWGWGAALCTPDEGPQVAHRNLLDERCAVLSEVPPLKHLPQEKKAPESPLSDTLPAKMRDKERSQRVHPLAKDQGWNLSPHSHTNDPVWPALSCRIAHMNIKEIGKNSNILAKCYVPPSQSH